MSNYATGEPCPIEVSLSERDMGIQLSNNFKFHEQTEKCVSKANKILGLLK